MILYINCCVRKESRTNILAKELLKTYEEEYKEVYVPDLNLQPLNEERLNCRTQLIEAGDYSDPMFDLAKEFAEAEIIVIAAPYWDLSFPTYLKLYIENIYINGIVTKYDETGSPVGLCKAFRLYYVTTAGGPYNSDYSYLYLREMATKYFGIVDTQLVFAQNLDIEGSDTEMIMENAKSDVHLLENLLKIAAGSDELIF